MRMGMRPHLKLLRINYMLSVFSVLEYMCVWDRHGNSSEPPSRDVLDEHWETLLKMSW